MKITACIGFMILGIIIDCGGVPTDHRGYIGARYWYETGSKSLQHVLTRGAHLGILHGTLSSTASMASALSSSQRHLPLAALNLLDWLPLKHKILGRKSPKQRDRLFGVFASSTSSTSSLSASLCPQTVRFTRAREPQVVIPPS